MFGLCRSARFSIRRVRPFSTLFPGWATPQFTDVRQGKFFVLNLDGWSRDEAQRQLEKISKDVLTNPVIEEYRFEMWTSRRARPLFPSLLRHSEERSDEKLSSSSIAAQERFLASLGMTDERRFFGAAAAAPFPKVI